MIAYLDSSALVKRYIQETGTDNVVALIDDAEAVGSVMLTQVEIASALGKAARLEWVEHSAANKAWKDFLLHWPSFTRISVTPLLAKRASQLSWEYGLRAYDAIHLAAVLNWQETLDIPIILAVFDRALWLAGQKAGLTVWPEKLFS